MGDDGMSELGKHIGCRLSARSARELRCWDHKQTILLPLTEPVVREPITKYDPNRCERHPGQHVDWCSGCAADAKEAQTAALPKRPTSTEAAREAARLALQEALRSRRPVVTSPLTDDDLTAETQRAALASWESEQQEQIA